MIVQATSRPRIAITMGDAAGVGPEIIVRAVADRRVQQWCVPVVLGDARVLRQAMEVTGTYPDLRTVGTVTDAEGAAGVIDCVDYADVDVEHLRVGTIAASNGAAAVRYTRDAARLALAGTIDGIVSAPLNKAAMHRAGLKYGGHTEIFAEEAGSSRCTMVVLLGEMRVMLFTNHVPLSRVIDFVTTERILDKLELADETLADLGVERRRIAVAGLNPHAGEEGILGREEIEAVEPAIEMARARGIDVVGPLPPDNIFIKARDGAFDLTLALYHDQGLIATKLLGFGSVVTLLAGLPFVRTSVGHGTAFDIAGTGTADHQNMIEAIRMAAEIGARRRPKGARSES